MVPCLVLIVVCGPLVNGAWSSLALRVWLFDFSTFRLAIVIFRIAVPLVGG